jgi:replicative DNA helicase
MSLDFGKIPPQATDIEMHVIGTIINQYNLIGKFPFLKPEVFYKDIHQKIYKSILDLYVNDKHPDLVILTEYMRNHNILEDIDGAIYLTKLSGMELANIESHVKIIMDKYFFRELIRLSSEVNSKSFESLIDPMDIISHIQNFIIDLIEFDGSVHDNFKHTLTATINKIIKSSKGDNDRVIKTGYIRIDKLFTFRTGYVCIIAGSEGSGKSKFTLSIIRGMLANEPNLAVQWFSFEEDREEIIRGFLASDMKMTTKELQSINYNITDEDIEKIEIASVKYQDYIIEFYDKLTSIGNIVTRSRQFSDKYKTHKRVIIIDNLGLIDCKLTGLERDDHIASKIKMIANVTGSSVILIHHFTKEISRKANIDDGYRPRKEYLKGSTRILDYVQQALFVNLINKYPDLIREEKRIPLTFIKTKDIEFTETNFDKHLWSINSQRCKETEAITDLRTETFVKLRTLLNNESKYANGEIITFSSIIQKYTEYSHYVDSRLKGKDEKYISQADRKKSIFIFIVKKMFNENYLPSDKSDRSIYLYGNNKNLRNYIDNLFIVESIKNRDDSNIDTNSIFRFISDLGYNIFKEINDDGDFDNS